MIGMKLQALEDCPSEQQLREYVQGKTAGQERFLLEDHLLDCPLCRAAVQVMEQYGEPTAEILNSVDQRWPAMRTESKREDEGQALLYRWGSYIAAAAVILLLVLAYSLYRTHRVQQELFSQYFDPHPTYGYVAVRSLGPQGDSDLLQAALQAHQSEDFTRSISSWSAYLEYEVDNLDYRPHLYLATANLALGELSEAADHLEQLPPSGDEAIVAEAMWYRALLDLRESKKSKAIERLWQLAATGNTVYAPQALELLAILK